MQSQLATAPAESANPLLLAMSNRQLLPQGHRAPGMVQTICRATSQALEHAGVGLILTDKRAAVRFVNTVAQPQLSGPCLSLQYGHLVASSRIDTARLHNAITAVTTRKDEPARTTPLSAGDGLESQSVLVAPLQLFHEAEESELLAMIVLVSKQTAVEEGRFRKAYGLTPAEARLLAALVQGDRLADYAARSNIRITTAKTHLQSLFAKTGEKRQADLIRRALSDPALRLHIG